MDMMDSCGQLSNGSAEPSESLLYLLAQWLKEHSLNVREHWRGNELAEIVVTNPQDPELGRAIISGDGYLTWERNCRFQTTDDARSIGRIIGVLLDENMSQKSTLSTAAASQAELHADVKPYSPQGVDPPGS
jgi:hypothetical protein